MEWYYADASGNQHAVSSADLPALVASGAVRRETLVWNETMEAWAMAGETCAEWFPHVAPPSLTGSQRRQALHAPVAPYAGQRAPLDPLAVISLALGCVGIFACGPFLAVPAVVCGHIARRRAKGENLPSSNGGLALAGLVTGYIGLVLSLLVLVFYGVAIVSGIQAGAAEGGGGDTP